MCVRVVTCVWVHYVQQAFGPLGTYMVTYWVTDQVGLTTTKTRTVMLVDTIKPNITINGAASVTLKGATVYQVK